MKRIILVKLLTLSALLIFGQDALLTQKTGNLNHFNPALVGTQSDMGVQSSYCVQWADLVQNPVTGSVLANYTFAKKWGLGLEYTYDRVGYSKLNLAKINVNKGLSIGKIELKLGSSIGYNNLKLDLTSLNPRQPNDPNLSGNNVGQYLSYDIGTAAAFKGFVAGVAAMQVNSPEFRVLQANSKLKPRYTGMLGYQKMLKLVNIQGLITLDQLNKNSLISSQIAAQYLFIKAGFTYHQYFGSFNNFDYVSGAVGVQFHKFSLNYSYADSGLRKSSNLITSGTHQVTAAWYIKGLQKGNGLSDFVNGMF